MARLIRARKAGSPLIVIPTALSVPACSKLSRYGPARAEYAARLRRRPTLTAPARVGFAILRVGAKKRNSGSNKETDQDNVPALKPLDKKGPIQGGPASMRRVTTPARKSRARSGMFSSIH